MKGSQPRKNSRVGEKQRSPIKNTAPPAQY